MVARPDYCPDIAFDPSTGNVHVVWTNDYSGPPPNYFLAYRRGTYTEDFGSTGPTWDFHLNPLLPQYRILDTNAPHTMYHPRIDIGDPGVVEPGGSDVGYVVGVVYDAYSSAYGPYQNYHHIGITTWDPDETTFPGGTSVTYDHLIYAPSNNKQDCGEPRVDIAPASNSSNYFSLVFTSQQPGGSYQVVEYNNKRSSNNGFLAMSQSGEGRGVYGAARNSLWRRQGGCHLFEYVSSGNWALYSTRFSLDSTTFDSWQYISDAYGSFSPSGNSDPGVEPGIVTPIGNKLWAAWCSYIDGTSTSVVHASYGDPT